jgi:hypothetical protein
MAHPTITTQKELRAQFWADHQHLTRKPGKTQNDYPADVRMAWVDYVDHMQRSGMISDKLADRATL